VLQKKNRVAVVEKAQAVQSAIRVGHIGIERNHPDYIACYVLNMLLGGYFNSRINLNLREKHGFTYGARSFFDTRKQTGAFAVSTEVRTEVTARAVEEIINELTLIRKEPVSADELSMVKNYIIGSFPLSIETPQQVAGRISTLALYGLDANYYDTFRDTVAALSREDLLRTAETYIHPDTVTIAASGDSKVLANDMKSFGDVEVYDHNFVKA
jgi:zinc protease